MVGVLLLTQGSFSVVYLATVNRNHVLDRIEESHIERMRNVARFVHED